MVSRKKQNTHPRIAICHRYLRARDIAELEHQCAIQVLVVCKADDGVRQNTQQDSEYQRGEGVKDGSAYQDRTE